MKKRVVRRLAAVLLLPALLAGGAARAAQTRGYSGAHVRVPAPPVERVTAPPLPRAEAASGAAQAAAEAAAGALVSDGPVGLGLVPPAGAGVASALVPETVQRGAALERRLLAALGERVRRQLGSGFAVVEDAPFVLASDLPAAVLRRRPLRTLRVCHAALRREYFHRARPAPVTIFAFRDRESYRYNLRRLWNEEPISPYGHYHYARRQIVFNCSTGLGTMVHEMVHALMDAEMPRAPIWFAEGLASLYEHCSFRDGRIRGVANWRLPELQAALAAGECPSLAGILTMSDAEFKGPRESLHYAVVRHFCLYLEEQGLLRRFYRRYRDRFAEDPSGRRFLEEVCEAPLAQLDARWQAWARDLPSGRGRVAAAE